jgi:Putative transposase
VRFLYGITLGHNTEWPTTTVPHMKHAIRRAEIYARSELEAILSVPSQPRDRAFLITVYACGLRGAQPTPQRSRNHRHVTYLGAEARFPFHLHCIVTGGALSPDGKAWRSPKQRKFLFPVQALGVLFRGKFLAELREMFDAGELHLPDPGLKTPATRAGWFSLLYNKPWVVYAKRPFGGAQQVLSYLANYN